MKKRNDFFKRIICLLLCGLIILSLFPVVFAAEEDVPIIGQNDVAVEINDWQHKVMSYSYSYAGNANDWKVFVELYDDKGTSKGYKEINMDTAITPSDPMYSDTEKAVSWYKNNNNQITVFIDVPRLNWNVSGKSFNLKVTCGSASKVTTFTSSTSVITGNILGNNLSTNATALSPSMGSKIYVPISAFSYNGNYIPLNIKNLLFTGDGSSTIKFVKDRMGGIIALELDHTSYGIINITALGADDNGTSYSNLSTRIHITESEKIYKARLAIANKTETFSVYIPNQEEGNFTLPFTVDVFANDVLDVSYKWRAALSPSAPGISISGQNIIITPEAIEGTYTLKIMPQKSASVIGSLSFELKRLGTDYVMINVNSQLTIPTSGQAQTVLTASVFRNGLLSTTDSVSWSVAPSVMGVSVSGNILTIASTAQEQTITLTATVNGNSSLYSKKEITLKKADVTIVPDDFEIAGVLNNKWEIEAPHGETKKITARALVGGKYNSNIEVGVQLVNEVKGVYIATGTSFNEYEIMANGIYEPTTLKLRLYSKVNPSVYKDIDLRIEPVIEGYVFSNSTISKRAVIEARGQLFVNSSDTVNAVMAIAVYRDGELIDIKPHSEKTEDKVSGGSSISFEGTITLPTDVTGIEVKILLLRGATLADATEVLAAPVILK